MNPKIKNAILSSFASLLIILFCFSLFLLYIEKSHPISYKDIAIERVEYAIHRREGVTKEAIKIDIDKLFNNNRYSLIECELEPPNRGNANILSRTIIVSKDLSPEHFAFVLAHELVHLNYYTVSERFCNIKAFEILYNSNDDYFKNIALMFADYDIRGYFDYEYSFVGYLTEILEDNNAIKTK